MNGAILSEMTEQSLLQLHTAFCAKVLGVRGDWATVQPLNLIKSPGVPAQKQAVLEQVPILKGAVRFQPAIKTTTAAEGHSHTIEVMEPKGVAPGDVVYCLCAERDLSDTLCGEFATPAAGHHMLSSAVIIGIF